MARFTLDARTFLAYVIQEKHSKAVRQFLDGIQDSDQLVGPAFVCVECTGPARCKVHEGALLAQEARAKLDQLLRTPVRHVTELGQHPRALEMAGQLGKVRAHDEHDLAVAELEGTEIVTIDGGMHQGAVNFKIPARLLR
jgi:predicted nucleic acid-binding protein